MPGRDFAHFSPALVSLGEPDQGRRPAAPKAARRGSSSILLVDQDPDQLFPVGQHLQQLGYAIEYANDGERALAIARQWTPLLVVLDKILPKLDGFEVCRILRRESPTTATPIIIASIDADETDRVIGLELGADDYLAKPFSTREMVLRIRNLLAHNAVGGISVEPCLRFDGLTIDVARHVVLIGDQPAELTATEFRLLELLARRNDFVHRRGELLEHVWKAQSNADDRTIDTHVRRLRQKLGTAGHMLETVRGYGYRFKGRIAHAHT